LSIVQAAGRAIDSDYVFILLVKIDQLIQMKAFEESMPLMVAIERMFNDKPWSHEKSMAIQYIQLQKVLLKVKSGLKVFYFRKKNCIFFGNNFFWIFLIFEEKHFCIFYGNFVLDFFFVKTRCVAENSKHSELFDGKSQL
jgi:hypothetical protein